VLVVAVVGYQFLPGRSGSGAPTPSLLARGEFISHGVSAQIDARGAGANVAGTMSLSDTGLRATVALECSRTTEAGMTMIGGLVTESTFDDGFPQGHRVAVIFQRGSPVQAVWWISLAAESPVASCRELVEDVIDPQEVSTALEPIEGNVELGP
jgi:hypothetical protein